MNSVMATSTWNELSIVEQDALLRRPALQRNDALRDKVQQIIAEVRDGGDDAIRRLTMKYDGIELEDTRVGDTEIAQAEACVSPAQLAAIDLAISNVRRFHEAQLPQPISVETMPGIRCERLSQPLDAVGLYVPAGSAPLPSTAIMLSVPAALAACPTRILCTPPRPDGRADPAVVIAAIRGGTNDIFKIGGAQAIAAMAYGSETVPAVSKVFGPGNAWVTAAKTAIAHDSAGAAIDMPAGPSELLVIADDSADAAFVAADLLSQAEHGADSQVLLLTDSKRLAATVRHAVQKQLTRLQRGKIAARALHTSRIVLTRNIDDAVAISNRYAPEHLVVQTRQPRELLARIRNAGSVFLGPWSPEAAGDYCSGTNHVLPTYGHARSYSGLSVDQFMRQTTVQELTEEGLRSIAASTLELASLEGLDAHANAVRIRFPSREDPA
jgi:histidinol dehydrogenase